MLFRDFFLSNISLTFDRKKSLDSIIGPNRGPTIFITKNNFFKSIQILKIGLQNQKKTHCDVPL